MADFTLTETDNLTISSDTSINNFIYQGGKIRLTPNIRYYKNESFIFNPTSSENPEDKIFNCLISRFALETGINGKFPKFKIYDLVPTNTPLFFPCMMFLYERSDEPSQYLFGDGTLIGLNISFEMAFKTDYKMLVDNVMIGEKDLAEHLLFNANQVLNDINYNSDYIKVGNIEFSPTVRYPKEPKQTLYGFSMDIFIEYLNIT